MKNLFLMGMAAVSMMCASCSSDENVEMANNKNAIEFKTFVNNSTRATDLTTASLMKFKLWGRMEKEDGTNKVGCSKSASKFGTFFSRIIGLTN